MSLTRLLCLSLTACAATMAVSTPAHAYTGVQIGASGKTYASADLQCALNPVTGMGPMVHAGLYNPRKTAKATVSLNGTGIASVSFVSPDAVVWLPSGVSTVLVSMDKRTADSYAFDAGAGNPCLPDTSGNAVSGDLEYAASGKSYATVTPGCAWNAQTGRAQPFVNLFDNGTYLLNVSINNVPLTQLSVSRRSTPVFLAAGHNVLSAANGTLSTDYYVRDGGTGACALP